MEASFSNSVSVCRWCENKEYRYNGKTYTMTQHGFARDMEFTLDSQTQDTLWFSIVSNETTMEKLSIRIPS